MKLKSFLTTGIYKRIDAHRHACSVLGLSTEGKAEAIRNTLISYVNDDKEKDEKVRSLITSFVENDGENASGPSQPSLFSQSQDKSKTGDSSDDDEDEDDDDDDDDVDVQNEMNDRNNAISSTPFHSKVTQKIPNALTKKIKSWMSNDGTHKEPSDADLNESIHVTETSFAGLRISEQPHEHTPTDVNKNDNLSPAIANSQPPPPSQSKDTHSSQPIDTDPSQTMAKHPSQPESGAQSKQTPQSEHATGSPPEPIPKPHCCDSNFMTVESRRIIASKDAQIKTLEHYLNHKESQVLLLED